MAKAAAKKSPVKAAAPAAVKASPKKVTKAKSPKKTKSPKKGGKKAGAKKVNPSPPLTRFLHFLLASTAPAGRQEVNKSTRLIQLRAAPARPNTNDENQQKGDAHRCGLHKHV